MTLAWILAAQAVVSQPALPSANAGGDASWNCGLSLGAGFGIHGLGSTQAHDLTVASLHFGKFLDRGFFDEAPLRRHLELGCELWSGAQYSPGPAYLVGLTPMVRCHFQPGARWSPFLEAGAGVTATDIGLPDLSTTFQFNSQFGAGLFWRIRPGLAFTADARYMHISNASIRKPNHGVNTLLFNLGSTWLFP